MMKRLVAIILLFGVAGVHAEGLFSRSMRSQAEDPTHTQAQLQVSWRALYSALNGYCSDQASGAASLARYALKKEIAVNVMDGKGRAIFDSSGDVGRVSERRNWEMVNFVKYAIHEKKLSPHEFGGFIGAACMVAQPLTVSFTMNYVSLDNMIGILGNKTSFIRYYVAAAQFICNQLVICGLQVHSPMYHLADIQPGFIEN